MFCWKEMEITQRSLCMFGSIFEIQTDTFDFVHVARQIKRKELTMLWNMQPLTFLRRPSQCAHNLKYLTCSCSILHTVSCYTASSVFRGMLCISDSYSGVRNVALGSPLESAKLLWIFRLLKQEQTLLFLEAEFTHHLIDIDNIYLQAIIVFHLLKRI